MSDNRRQSVEWSIRIVDADTSEELHAHQPDRSLRTASVAKLLLLTEVAARIEEDPSSAQALLTRDLGPAVADSGLWQALSTPALPRVDVASLVAAVSDNLATNVLLADVGLAAVRDRAESLGLAELQLLDFVRDGRTPEQPPTLSLGCAGQWAELLTRAHRGTVVDERVSARLRDWMALSVDLSMVAAPWHLDPLIGAVREPRLFNKTGSDRGVRADVGLRTGPARTVAWAVIANWTEPEAQTQESPEVVDAVYAELAALGTRIEGWAFGR